MTEAQLKMIGAAVIATALYAAGGAVAWFWQANAYRKVIAANEADHQSDLTAITNAGAAQARRALPKQPDAEQKVAILEKAATEEKKKVNAENETLRRAVADCTRGLRIAGSCTGGDGNVSQATCAASVGDVGTVELSPATGRAVFDLIASIIDDQAALKAAQSYITEVCHPSLRH